MKLFVSVLFFGLFSSTLAHADFAADFQAFTKNPAAVCALNQSLQYKVIGIYKNKDTDFMPLKIYVLPDAISGALKVWYRLMDSSVVQGGDNGKVESSGRYGEGIHTKPADPAIDLYLAVTLSSGLGLPHVPNLYEFQLEHWTKEPVLQGFQRYSSIRAMLEKVECRD